MDEVFELRTFHKTKVFFDPKRGLFHAAKSEAMPLQCRFKDGKIILSDQQTFDFVKNKDGSIAIVANKKFLSTRKVGGKFGWMPVNKEWEHFVLVPIEAKPIEIKVVEAKPIEAKPSVPIEKPSIENIPPVDRDHCAGCTACASVCPRGALTMVEDDEGFLSPKFDQSLCIKCGRCEKVCPILHPNKNPEPEISYAAWIKDEARREISSSGGLSFALMQSVIESGGVVCGAAIENFVVKHILVDREEDLIKLQGTKYVQSDPGDCFVEIKKLLSAGRKVLFAGTPCQVAGLKNFIGASNENLLTVDLVCHGVPSPGVLRKYLAELRRRHPTAKSMSFRDKVYGWHPLHAFALYDETSKRVFREGGPYNVYIKGFLGNVFNRRSCSHCPFAAKERVGDITLSDYWGLKKFDPKLVDKKGVSMTLLNTSRGIEFFDAIKNKLGAVHEVPYKIAISSQGQLNHPITASSLREKFFQSMREGKPVEAFLERRLFPVGLLNFHFANSFGALLVSYSLQRAVESLGYPVENINYVVKRTPVTAFVNFRGKFIKTSKTPLNRVKLKTAGYAWKRIIIGSDQVWKMFDTNVFMCDWASGRKTLISYAASFGHARYAGKVNPKRAKKLLERFDFISVREASGVNICKNDFGVDAFHVIDPTLLLTREHYEGLINPTFVTLPDKPYVVVAFVNAAINKIPADSKLLGDFRENFVLWNSLANEKGVKRSMSTWLASIKNAEYIITDSFHVTAFSILFNKQFVTIVNANGLARIPSLLKQVGIPSTRIYKSIKDVSLKSFDEKIDYTRVNPLVEKEREKGFMFLRLALAAPLNQKDPVK